MPPPRGVKGIQKTGREKHVPFLYFLIGNLVLFDWRIIETVNDQLKNICQVELDPPSLLPKLHYQSVIGFGRFLLLRQKTFHQHR